MVAHTSKQTHDKKETKHASVRVSENMPKGLLLAALSIPAGVIVWLLLWKMGFIASLASFVVAILAVKLYEKGAGSISKKAAMPLISLILIGVVFAFMSGVASDAYDFYVEDSGMTDAISILFSGDFWSFFFENISMNAELWSTYTNDILLSLLFAALGTFSVIRGLFVSPDPKHAV